MEMKQYVVWVYNHIGEAFLPLDFDTFKQALAYWQEQKNNGREGVITEFIPLVLTDGRTKEGGK